MYMYRDGGVGRVPSRYIYRGGEGPQHVHTQGWRGAEGGVFSVCMLRGGDGPRFRCTAIGCAK